MIINNVEKFRGRLIKAQRRDGDGSFLRKQFDPIIVWSRAEKSLGSNVPFHLQPRGDLAKTQRNLDTQRARSK